MEEKFYHTYFKSGDEYSYWQLFCIKDNKIHRVSYRNSMVNHECYIPCIDLYYEEGFPLDYSLSDEENIIKANNHFFHRDNFPGIIVCKSDLIQGEHYSNIYRPIFSLRYTKRFPTETDLKVYFPLYDRTEYISRLNQLAIIYHDLSEIFKYIEPEDPKDPKENSNMKVYGHRIRNNIILSCTEIDSMFQNLMLKNGYKSKEYRFKTNDYIKTKSILKLDQYAIYYLRYPNLPLFSPFINWKNINSNSGISQENNTPTKSIIWYDAYNQIKHDRIKNKKLANLKNAVDAFSAAIILFIAQYGDDEPFWKKELGDEISIYQKPHFEYNESYLPPISSDSTEWTEKYYQF